MKMKVGSLRSKLRELRLRWKGHISRKEEDYVGRAIQQMKVGKRKRGRPKRRWRDCVKEDMEEAGLQEADAHDRALWKDKSTPATPHKWE